MCLHGAHSTEREGDRLPRPPPHTHTAKSSTRVSRGETQESGDMGPRPYAFLARSSTACSRAARFLPLRLWKRGSLNPGPAWL